MLFKSIDTTRNSPRVFRVGELSGKPLHLSWLLCLFTSGIATAEQITVVQALRAAETAHPRLKAGAARTDGAQGRIAIARAYPNPQVSGLTGQQFSQPPGGRRFNVPLFTVTQPLELGPLRPARMELARRGLENSETELTVLTLAILANVRRTFYEVLRRDSEIIIAQESLRLAQQLRDRIRVRVEVGEVGRLELIRAEAEVSTARSFAANVRAARAAALAAFQAAMGSEGSTFEPSGSLPVRPAPPNLKTLREQVLKSHPSLVLSQAQVRRAQASRAYEVALKRPQPNLLGEFDNTNPSFRFGVSLELPAWNRRAGQIAVADAEAREAQHLVDARRVDLLAALESAFERYQVSTQEVEALQEGLMREADEAVRAAELAYQLGERSIIEVLDAQRVMRAVRMNLLNAQFDRNSASIEIDELRGQAGEGRP